MGSIVTVDGGGQEADRFGGARPAPPRGQRFSISSPTFTALGPDPPATIAVRGLAHDLNNLLALILGHAEMALANAAAGTGLRNALEQITHAADLGAALTGQLLRSSPPRAHAPLPGGLNAVVRRAIAILSPLLNPAITLRMRLAHGLPAVAGDAVALEQLVINLTENAAEAMPAGGTLTVSTEGLNGRRQQGGASLEIGLRKPCPPKWAVLTVADTGVGMDPATLGRAFEPCFTAKKTGTGLGLPMVQRIARLHGGDVAVQSQAGKGSIFSVILPTLASRGEPEDRQRADAREAPRA